MLLYEYEGKELLQKCGIKIPQSQLLHSSNDQVTVKLPVVLKAQVLSGKRADAGGIVKIAGEGAGITEELATIFSKTINNERVTKILVEEMVFYDKEYYISISYDTQNRGPILTISENGGTGIEQRTGESKSFRIDILNGLTKETAESFMPLELIDTAVKIWEVFTKNDCELVEINPLVVDKNGEVWALDAKIILDDDADFRRELTFPERNLFGRSSTQAEIEARKIDEGDHRGTAGSVYWDLDGDIAVIAAGGGGSVVNMDALVAYGGKPANYTEHSGNPPRNKLTRLTKIVLSKPGLKGCWFVGGTANFTDIYETLAGFVDGLRELDQKPTYPIVIRRGGPRDQEAFQMLREVGEKEGYDFHIYDRETPMTSTAKVMVDLAYGKGGNK